MNAKKCRSLKSSTTLARTHTKTRHDELHTPLTHPSILQRPFARFHIEMHCETQNIEIRREFIRSLQCTG